MFANIIISQPMAVMTLSEFLSTTYTEIRPDASEPTLNQYRIAVQLYSSFLFRPAELSDLTEEMVRSWLASYRKHASPATVMSKRRAILAIWRAAWEDGIVANPPKAKRIPVPKFSPPIPEAWTVAEVRCLLAVTACYRRRLATSPTPAWWRAIIMVAYYTGERIGAILTAKTSDFSSAGGWIVFKNTKTRTPRLCKLPPECVSAIRSIEPEDGEALLFHHQTTCEALRKTLKAFAKSAGLSVGRGRGGIFHKLRRTAGSLAEAEGMDGSRFLGNTRRVFLQSYCDPRIASQWNRMLPTLQ